MKVGFVGLGRMGSGMAHRILGAGHDMVVFDAVAAQAEPFVKGGARAAASLAEVCAGREVVVSMLVEDAVVLDVVTGKGGLRDSLAQGAIHLVMGTHGVATIRALDAVHTAAGQTLVASPVPPASDITINFSMKLVEEQRLHAVLPGVDGVIRFKPRGPMVVVGQVVVV